jgi:hypothetical protein
VSSAVTNGTACTYDGLDGICVNGVCGDDLCENVVCDDEPCGEGWCDYVDGTCRYTPRLPNGTDCTYDGLDGVCVNGVCGENLCEDVVCEEADRCVQGSCDFVDGTCDFVPVVCDDQETCTEDTCDPADGCIFTAVEDGTRCGGTNGVCDAGVCVGPLYTQDFESLDQASSSALSDDGWVVSGNVFEADGTTFVRGYGPFPAPNGGEGFCAIETMHGGPEQGAHQLSIYCDYYNFPDHMAGNRVQANTYRERVITAGYVGKTVTFSFDAKRGNINHPDVTACIDTPNPPCDSTAGAFIKAIDPMAGDVTTSSVEQDTTEISDTWDRYSISMEVEPGLVDQLLQFGFSATASNFEPAGVLYDNIVVELAAP